MQSRRNFMCGCLGALAACAMFPGATRARMVDILPPSDPADGKTFRVLCMHDVRDNLISSLTSTSSLDVYAIDTGTLTAIFSWLQNNNYHTVTVKQIEASRHGGPPLPPRAVLLTFDDGFRSHFTKVLPLLKRFNYPAVMGIVTAWIDTPPDMPVRISETESMPREVFMSWDDVRQLGASGLVEVASHTHNLHHGATANPQGNQLPATTAYQYLIAEKRYETDAEFSARIRDDLSTSIEQIRDRAGVVARSMVWPYGAENQPVRVISAALGMDVQFSLEAGPNTPDVPLDRLRRILMTYDVDIGGLERSMREPAANRGVVNPIERVVQVNLDDVYDPVPERQEQKLGELIERMYQLHPSSVYLQAFSDPHGSGVAESVYFPNRHLPVRADLFSRAAWQLNTRAFVQVFAWMPVLAFRPPAGTAARMEAVSPFAGAPTAERGARGFRLSPFDPAARTFIKEIYEDLGKYAKFGGLLFGQDILIDDYEDASANAMRTYVKWGLPPDIARIRAEPDLMRRWSQQKTQHLIDLTLELESIVFASQNGGDVLTVRTLSAQPVLNPASEAWYAQNYTKFLQAYDYVALMAMPYMEQASNPDRWLDSLVDAMMQTPGAVSRTVFELQAFDWHTRTAIPSATLLAQMRRLRERGVVNFGYYPDSFARNEPDILAMRDVMSVKARLDRGSINALMKVQATGKLSQ
jgi:biofilm PGA synthesis lipoprotein PgaB